MSFPFDPFAELSQLQKTQANNGIDFKDLAGTACNVMCRTQGRPTFVLQDADLDAWVDVAKRAAQIVDLPESELAELNVSAKAFAKTIYVQFMASTDKIPDWENAPHEARISWEAVARHLANLIDSDGQTPNYADLEDRITEWAKERTHAAQLVLS